MADWQQSLANIINNGRQGDMSQDKMYANDPTSMPTTDRGVTGDVSAIPLGDISDPVSMLASIAAKPILSSIQSLMQQGAIAPSVFRNPIMSSQRGSTGVPSGDEGSYEALKKLVLSRNSRDSSVMKQGESYKDFLADPDKYKPYDKSLLVEPDYVQSTLQKSLNILNDYNAITKDILKDEFVKRYGSIDNKVVDKLWSHFVKEGVINELPEKSAASYGYHRLNDSKLVDIQTGMKRR